ncbi:MAG: Mpo1-like protein [Deltaproteobacteria bacterium]
MTRLEDEAMERAMAVMGRASWDEWIEEYQAGHLHPVNRLCHTLGIPMIALSLLLAVPAAFVPALRWPAAALFSVGWIFQFIGHGFEGKPPEFFKDPRFLFVGLRWWFAKVWRR